MTTPMWEPQPGLGAATLESVLEMNEQALVLLRAQCQVAGSASPLIQDVRDLLLNLDAQSMRRVAASAVLLVDAAFADAGLWSGAIVGGVNDHPQVAAPFFTVDGSVALMQLVMTQAWHLARSQPAAARLLLGLSAPNLSVIGGCTLSRLMRLAETRSHWLRPRWENRGGIWRDLLQLAGSAEGGALERLRLRGLQLLAADARPG